MNETNPTTTRSNTTIPSPFQIEHYPYKNRTEAQDKKSILTTSHISSITTALMTTTTTSPKLASITLPLLNGLSHHPSKCSSLIEEALLNYHACYILKRFFDKFGTNHNKKDSKIKFHWIFQCLSNPCLHLRRRASDVILKGLSLLVTSTARKKKDYLFILRKVLFDLVEENILPVESSESYSTCMVSTMSGSDVLLQIFGLFHYFICDYTGGSFLEKKGAKKVVRKEEWCRESFVGNGGIRWICASLVRLIRHLAHLRSRQQILDTIVNETIQTRIFLFVDLLYRLVSTKSKSIHTLFYQSNLSSINVCGIPWTPLTTSIATLEILKGKILPSKVRGLERTCALLERMVDPARMNLNEEPVKKKKRKKSHCEAALDAIKKRRIEAAASRSHIASRGLLQDIRSRSGFLFGASAIASREIDSEEEDDDMDEMISDDDVDEDDVVIHDSDEDVCEEEEDSEHEEMDDDCEDMIVCEEEEEEDDYGSCDEMPSFVSRAEGFLPSGGGNDDDSSGSDELEKLLAEEPDQESNIPQAAQQVKSKATSPLIPQATLNERKEIFLRSAMRVLQSQHRYYISTSPDSFKLSFAPPSPTSHDLHNAFPILTIEGERSLCKSLCNIVQPPPKPLNLKLFLRRAPTQEEFFRGSLSKNPVALTALNQLSNTNTNGNSKNEATFSTLRQHIANDLQMADSSELLELLVAGKIIDINLPIRVVQQVVWKKHVIENSHSSLGELSIPPPGVIYTGYNDDTDISQLPPMVVTYRLAGVDGEATEDKVEVGDIEDPEQVEKATDPEKEFEITKFIAERKGLSFLLRSIERDIADVLRRIRRDDVFFCKKKKNPSRVEFLKASAPSGLILLRLCARLKVNRQKLVLARAPSLLLRLLLDVLNAFDGPKLQGGVVVVDSEKVVSNPTSEALQELIEVLASEISVETPSSDTFDTKLAAYTKSISTTSLDEKDMELEDATLPLLFNSLREASLSAHLRKVIANLLPFLTYGQESLSRALASQYLLHVNFDLLSTQEDILASNDHKAILMDTLIEAAINLPCARVCETFRSELLSQGFVDKVVKFVMRDLPLEPPPWSQALWPKPSVPGKQSIDDTKSHVLQKEWRQYLLRPNLRIGFQILIGLCARHPNTQFFVAASILKCCHWIESTSDASAGIELKGLGLLAETLLDTLKVENEVVEAEISALRKKTRERKREIAEERRNRALVGMSAFGPLAGASFTETESNNATNSNSAASALASMLGISLAALASSGQRIAAAAMNITPATNESKAEQAKPSWMEEMEALEDDEGLTCAVCQEGRGLQPKELLGLYAYVKKVSIPHNKGGARSLIDGSQLLFSLPTTLPKSLLGSEMETKFFRPAKEIAAALQLSSPSVMSSLTSTSAFSSSSRPSHFITSVTAGNAIHCSCHSRARMADRNHPKAPKSEWEGASLRNSRVTCNVIIPLVSSKSSQVPLVAVESALADHQSIISNMLGARPKSMLWTVLHDVRFLLLRIAYDEPLNADCGGGSVTSNLGLVFHLLFMVDMFAKDAEHDSPASAQHVKNISLAYLAACEIVDAPDCSSSDTISLLQGLSESSIMAGMCSILFYNHEIGEDGQQPQWTVYRDQFLKGFIRYAGKRYAAGIEDSGCVSKRTLTGNKRSRACSFGEWEILESVVSSNSTTETTNSIRTYREKRILKSIEEYSSSLRPIFTLFAILDQLSKEYRKPGIMDDVSIAHSAETLTSVVKCCKITSSVQELFKKNIAGNSSLSLEQVVEEFDKGRKLSF